MPDVISAFENTFRVRKQKVSFTHFLRGIDMSMNMSKTILATAAISAALSAPAFADTPTEMAYIFVKGHPAALPAPVINAEAEVMDLDDKQFAIELAKTEGNTAPMIATSSAPVTSKLPQRQAQMNTALQSRQFRTFLSELAKSEGG
jgi:hypothetical protein